MSQRKPRGRKLHPSDGRILLALDRLPWTSPPGAEQLSRAAQVDVATTRTRLHALTASGLTHGREPDDEFTAHHPGRPGMVWALTQEGKKLTAALANARPDLVDKIEGASTPARRTRPPRDRPSKELLIGLIFVLGGSATTEQLLGMVRESGNAECTDADLQLALQPLLAEGIVSPSRNQLGAPPIRDSPLPGKGFPRRWTLAPGVAPHPWAAAPGTSREDDVRILLTVSSADEDSMTEAELTRRTRFSRMNVADRTRALESAGFLHLVDEGASRWGLAEAGEGIIADLTQRWPTVARQTQPKPRGSLLELVRGVLAENGGAMEARQIHRVLTARGHNIPIYSIAAALKALRGRGDALSYQPSDDSRRTWRIK